jgi:hypothetical protein
LESASFAWRTENFSLHVAATLAQGYGWDRLQKSSWRADLVVADSHLLPHN